MKRLFLASLTALAASSPALAGEPWQAKATLIPIQGNAVQGNVMLSQNGDWMLVHIAAHGLSPGRHAIHIHEHGHCDSQDGKSAGGHFHPFHGSHHHETPEIPDIVSDEHGNATLQTSLSGLQLGAGEHAVLGRSIVIHAFDRHQTENPRIACGVIQATSPELQAASQIAR